MDEFILRILVKVFVMVAILPLHEYAHGWAAKKMGDKTAMMLGRLTLNPAKHLDLFGAIFMLVFGFGWAKPVPVNSENFKWKNKKAATAIVAAAGPLSNLIAAIIGCFIWGLVLLFNPSETFFVAISTVFVYFIQINITLAVFNLIPFPPLDGSKILYMFLPDKWIYFIESNSRYLLIALFALMYLTGFGSIVSTVGSTIFGWMISVVNAFYGLFY